MIRLAAACLGLAVAFAAPAAQRLRIATWNLEWMLAPEVFDRLARSCTAGDARRRGAERAIPCDLVPKARWSEGDLARLAAFARGVDADVVALQEIDGVDAARRIFPDHDYCFTRRRHVQNVGFAIRRGIPFRCNRDLRSLGGSADDVRWGADVTIRPDDRRALRLLAVHLKSGCNRDPLTDARRPACAVLQRQVPVLEDWIDRRAQAGEAFGVIGDFNRRFDRDRKAARDAHGRIVALWPEIDDGVPAGADLVDPGAGRGAIACGNGYGPRMPIDYLILGGRLAERLVPGSWRVHDYPGSGRWPDHCLLSIELED